MKSQSAINRTCNALLMLAIFFGCYHSKAQKVEAGKVVIPVQKFFMIRYPEHKHEQFELKGDTIYEIKFDLNNAHCKTWFMVSGTWLGDETEIPVAQLKPVIVQYINKEYAGCTITLACKLQDLNYATTYKVIIRQLKQEKDLRFSDDGSPVKTP